MDGLAQSVGHGLGSVVGGALNSIAATISSIVNQTSRVVPGGFPIWWWSSPSCCFSSP